VYLQRGDEALTRAIRFSIDEHEGVKIVRLGGNISNVTRNEFLNVINELTKKNNIIIDLSDVGVFTSSGLDALQSVSIEAKAHNTRVLLLGANESLIKMVEILDVYDDFIFVENVEEAITKLKYYI
jgi:anti-anti-sigma factor